MPLITESEARQAARRVTKGIYTADSLLTQSAKTAEEHYDIFLSHSSRDAEIVLGISQILKELGKTVYVDWIVDKHLSRDNVTPETARLLRIRMKQCDSLFYLYSPNSTGSRWMPWELGFFDGYKGTVAILPVVQTSRFSFKGEEYLGLYPYVDIDVSKMGNRHIYINRDKETYKEYYDWTKSTNKLKPGYLYA